MHVPHGLQRASQKKHQRLLPDCTHAETASHQLRCKIQQNQQLSAQTLWLMIKQQIHNSPYEGNQLVSHLSATLPFFLWNGSIGHGAFRRLPNIPWDWRGQNEAPRCARHQHHLRPLPPDCSGGWDGDNNSGPILRILVQVHDQPKGCIH